jgi:hypothetical protein
MGRFAALYESAIQRFTRGGFLTGDLVKFTDKAFNDDFFKKQAPNYIDKAKSFASSGRNIRVSAVKAVRPTIHSGNVQNEAYSFLVDIVLELAPGLYKEFLTVPAHLLQRIDTGINLAPVPDDLKRKDNTKIKPEEEHEIKKDDNFTAPHRQTNTSDLGNKKDSEGDRKLDNTNIRIPSSPAIDSRDPSVKNSTARYLPKK